MSTHKKGREKKKKKRRKKKKKRKKERNYQAGPCECEAPPTAEGFV
jgi:hypothetical protein